MRPLGAAALAATVGSAGTATLRGEEAAALGSEEAAGGGGRAGSAREQSSFSLSPSLAPSLPLSLPPHVAADSDCWSLLTHLDVRGNVLGDEGATLLGHVLLNCRRLQRLHVGSNEIGDGGIKSIADSLRRLGATFQLLDASANQIGPAGME
eukprot:1478641-Rhodomonas_salina.1